MLHFLIFQLLIFEQHSNHTSSFLIETTCKFKILKNGIDGVTAIPATLLEVGFINNAVKHKKLVKTNY